jgi:curli biogenesis system outer membrane secretion channel CsgG/Tfp pilus assembly protein PilF
MLISACATIDPAKVDVQLPETVPVQKVTNYTQSLRNLGLMTEIYDTGQLKIQSNPIGDNTGTSGATGGEIPKDITEMLKSALNSIGGNVVFIPYDPAFIQNQMVTGYSNFDKKLIPDVVVSGGITEFDRGLETRGTGTDFGGEGEVPLSIPLPSYKVALDVSDAKKTGLARITLDFNLLDFRTMAGIPRMNTVNSMEVTKALSEKEFGITLFGPTFGRKGSIKRVQGRHNAVRLLVEVSMIQIVGKNLVLPYWRLIGDDTQPDEIVLSTLKKSYYRMNDSQRIHNTQQWLYLHGFDVTANGVMDDKTISALKQFKPAFVVTNTSVDVDTFSELYLTIPIDEKTLGRRMTLTNLMQAQASQPAPDKTPHQSTDSSQNHSKDDPQTKSAELLIEAGRYFRQRNFGKAAGLFTENLQVLPSPETYFYLSLCYQEMKDMDKSIACLREGTNQFPLDALLWKSLGQLAYEKGDVADARKYLGEALRLSPEDRQAKFLFERMEAKN